MFKGCSDKLNIHTFDLLFVLVNKSLLLLNNVGLFDF